MIPTNIGPTRMELIGLERRLEAAVRGHRLLVDRRDRIARHLMPLARERARLRAEVEADLRGALAEFALCAGAMEPAMLEQAALYPAYNVRLAVGVADVLSVRVPRIEIDGGGLPELRMGYGLAETSAALDGAIRGLAGMIPRMIRLAELEKTCCLLAAEIESTRWRADVLRRASIPNLRDGVRFISMELDEDERDCSARMMVFADGIAAHGDA